MELKNMKLEVYYSKEEIKSVLDALKKTYNFLEIGDLGSLELLENAYDSKRNQYNATILLDHLIKTKKTDFAIWLVHKDLYTVGMNFIFGLASFGEAAVISTYRLYSQELINKETIHEVGHILGLRHCYNLCVMQFSNSLFEAEAKPSELCKKCKNTLSTTLSNTLK